MLRVGSLDLQLDVSEVCELSQTRFPAFPCAFIGGVMPLISVTIQTHALPRQCCILTFLRSGRKVKYQARPRSSVFCSPSTMSFGENGYIVVSDAINPEHILRVERELREIDIMALIAETMRKPDAASTFMTELPWTHSCTEVLKDFIRAVPHSPRGCVSSVLGLATDFPSNHRH